MLYVRLSWTRTMWQLLCVLHALHSSIGGLSPALHELPAMLASQACAPCSLGCHAGTPTHKKNLQSWPCSHTLDAHLYGSYSHGSRKSFATLSLSRTTFSKVFSSRSLLVSSCISFYYMESSLASIKKCSRLQPLFLTLFANIRMHAMR